jgi:hypothetical protein
MSIPLGERRKLRATERALASGAPALEDRFAMFGALYRWDELPSTERLKAREVARLTRVERWIAPWLEM